jgi:hypothetical protein
MVTGPAGVGPENDYAGENQQQLNTTNPSSRQKGCYIRIITSIVQLENKIAGRELKGLVAKTN